MSQSSRPFPVADEQLKTTVAGSCSRPLPMRIAVWCLTGVWRTCVDWRTKRPLLTRITAHFSIILLALAAIAFSGMALPMPRAAMGSSANLQPNFLQTSAFLAEEPAPTPTAAPASSVINISDPDTVARMPVPETTIPERQRIGVMTYTVQVDDTIYGIAAAFGLMPETIVWSNREILYDAPWLIQPGIELYIMPEDGVYHTVLADETAASIAEYYGVDVAALYNEWNDVKEGVPLREGQLLVIPGATGDEVEWMPPPSVASPGSTGASYGVCGGVSVSGPGASGWFILPTGGQRVSGWYFHDPRNPTHIGLDYGCRLGDPIYAADNGVVTIAGWNGGYGIMVEVNHGNGFVTRYAHFSELAVGCGTPVYQGQVVGYCGSTGWSTGAHLHFEVRLNGAPQDPQAY
jgi:murein DD-endopeptidase MepM/ murein hydrolase activator NlpD